MIVCAVRFLAPLSLLAAVSCVEQAAVGPTPESVDSAERIAKLEEQATKSFSRDSSGADRTPVTRGRVTRIMLGDLFARQQNGTAYIIDVRPSYIYKLGHIPGAVNWPKSHFQSDLATFEPRILEAKAAGKPVVLYCVDLACPDARTVATWLSERGHSVVILEGGWDAWKTGQLPTE